MTRRDIFEHIYASDAWRGGQETRSGVGSLRHLTKGLRLDLPVLLKQLEIGSILDAGCGDVNWLPLMPGIDYTGVDVVPDAIEEAQRRHPTWRFQVADIVEDDLPWADAILARDVLQHLARQEVLWALQNFTRTGAEWLLATTFPESDENDAGGHTGGYTEWDLERPPFELGPPETGVPYTGWWLDDHGRYVAVADAFLGAWKL